MKRIVLLGAALAMLTSACIPTHASGNRFELDRQWSIEQAQQRKQDAYFKALDANAAKEIRILEHDNNVGQSKPNYLR